MIGSVFEQRDQLAALEKRRQEIAAQRQAPAQHAPGIAAQVAAPLAAGMPVAGYAAPASALKGAEPDVTKRRKGKDRDLRAGPVTDAHEAAQAGDSEHAAKNFRERGITEGPGDSREPGRQAPEQFQRPYESEGHAAQAPMSAGPRENPNPVPSMMRGIPVPIQMSSAPMAAGIPTHIASTYSMGSPSDR